MRVLLDTHVLIHRETSHVVRENIGLLFRWLDEEGHDKVVHPLSVAEIRSHKDDRVRRSFEAKLQSYEILIGTSKLAREVQQIGAMDVSQNDRVDTALLNEVFVDRVDYIISEDKGVSRKAA